jgi:hypothetical protein
MRKSSGRFMIRVTAIVGSVLGAALASAPAAAQSPQLIRFDGGAYDRAGAIAVDGAGNSYLAGAVDEGAPGSSFAVVKLGPDGSVRWSARYDGSRGGVGGQASAVTVDTAGNVYAAGFVHDGVIFNQNYDYLVVKFGPEGGQRWALRYNGPGNNSDFARQVVVDGAGNVYVTGFSYGAEGYDWATLKLAADGSLRWERRLSGPGRTDDRAVDMALLPDGNLVVTGVTQNTGDGLTNDAETVAYDTQGGVVWRARWTDTALSHELIADLDADSSGRTAITGTTQESASPYAVPTPVTLRYDRSGALLQAIRSDGGSSVDIDPAGSFYVAGFFIEQLGPSSVAKFDADGRLVWSTPLTLGDPDFLSLPQVAADGSGAVTVAGTVRDLSTHNSDYLTIRFARDGSEQWRYRFAGVADPGQQDEVAGLAVNGDGDAFVTGTSWNGYLSIGGTANDIVTLRFPAGTAPALTAPGQLAAAALSSSQIRLRWQDTAGTEDGFRIERCAGSGCTAFAQIAVVGHDVTGYVDGGLTRNTAYSYRVRAFNAGGASAYSNTATAKTRRK